MHTYQTELGKEDYPLVLLRYPLGRDYAADLIS